jgi:hypothetical protein
MPLINIYGNGSGNVYTCPAPPQGNKNVVEYMKRFMTIMKQLNKDHDKDTAINRIEVIKAQIMNDLGGDIKLVR